MCVLDEFAKLGPAPEPKPKPKPIPIPIPSTSPAWVPFTESEIPKILDAFCDINALRCKAASGEVLRFLFSLLGGIRMAEVLGARWKSLDSRGDAADAEWTRQGHTYRLSVKMVHKLLFGKTRTTVAIHNTHKSNEEPWTWPENPSFDYLILVGFHETSGLDVAIIPESTIRASAVIGPSQVKYTFESKDCVDSCSRSALEVIQVWDDHYLRPWGTVVGNPRDHREKFLNNLWEEAVRKMSQGLHLESRGYTKRSLNLTP